MSQDIAMGKATLRKALLTGLFVVEALPVACGDPGYVVRLHNATTSVVCVQEIGASDQPKSRVMEPNQTVDSLWLHPSADWDTRRTIVRAVDEKGTLIFC